MPFFGEVVHVVVVHCHDLVLFGEQLGHDFVFSGTCSSLLNDRFAQPLVLGQLPL